VLIGRKKKGGERVFSKIAERLNHNQERKNSEVSEILEIVNINL
jgi:hypothetical protein